MYIFIVTYILTDIALTRPYLLIDMKFYIFYIFNILLFSKTLKDKSFHDKNEYQCPICPYDAISARDLETHHEVHHLKRRFYRCAKCCYVTHVRARFTKHIKYHSMPMIKCDACDFRTPYKVCLI